MSRDTLLDVFTAAALEAAQFADAPDGFEGPLADDLLNHVARDCAAFWAAHQDSILCEGAPRAMDWDTTASESEQVAAQAGHDFWLTRQGHGAGFWDGDWPEPAATVLANAADAVPAFSVYVDDAGELTAEEVNR